MYYGVKGIGTYYICHVDLSCDLLYVINFSPGDSWDSKVIGIVGHLSTFRLLVCKYYEFGLSNHFTYFAYYVIGELPNSDTEWKLWKLFVILMVWYLCYQTINHYLFCNSSAFSHHHWLLSLIKNYCQGVFKTTSLAIWRFILMQIEITLRGNYQWRK